MKNPTENDEGNWAELMLQAQHGNEVAYHQLLTELADAIARYLRVRFGAIEELEDCVQESLMAIHQARNTYEAGRLFRPWMFAIVRHKTIDVLRKNNKHKAVLEAQSVLLDNEPVQPDSEKAIHCGKILSSLSEQHRQAIVLTKLEGLSMREAAEHLAISEGAMKVRVHRALNASRRLLEAEFR